MSSNLEKIEKAFNYKLDDVDYLSNISINHKYMYYEIPKAACTTIKNTLQFYESNVLFTTPDEIHNKKISSLKGLYSNKITEKVFFDNKYYKFSFVRNPFTRILSCYLDKINGAGTIYGVSEKLIFRKDIGVSTEENINFLDFLRIISKQSPNKMNIHWRPQSTILADEKIHYHYIGRFEFFQRDFSYVLMKIGIENPTEAIKIRKNHETHSLSKIKEYFAREEIKIIQDIYGLDFLRYGYSLFPPF